jgi:uncharacterized membrane protein YkvA (DUF1232 family)
VKFLARPLYGFYSNILRNSKYRWFVIAASVFYLVSPFDLITDFIPVVGWIDDGVIATVLAAEVSQLIKEQLTSRKAKDKSLKVVGQT